ncbi:MAG: hypothetical protein JNJ44_11970 [Zoogloeaceae bacterium]|nr:hypothetical protein [Zoogloeaceae bacterium]
MIHPATALLLWAALVIVTQSLGGWMLVLVVVGIAGIAFRLGRTRFWRLLRRIRFILLAIVILFAWMTPGDALVPIWVAFGPTLEGCRLAFDHGVRLIGVVSLVAILLSAGGRDFLISGLYTLSRPAALLGISREQLAVRLLLVLRFVEEQPVGSWREWLSDGAGGEAVGLHVVSQPLRWLDWGLLSAIAVAFALWERL